MKLRILKPLRGSAITANPGDVMDQPDEMVARLWIRTRTAEEVLDHPPGVVAATRRRKAVHQARETR